MRPLKAKAPFADNDVARAIDMLKNARDLLKLHDCPRTLARVRLAITSAEGAQRHMHRRKLAVRPASFSMADEDRRQIAEHTGGLSDV